VKKSAIYFIILCFFILAIQIGCNSEPRPLIQEIQNSEMVFALKYISKNELSKRPGYNPKEDQQYKKMHLFDFKIKSKSGNIKNKLLENNKNSEIGSLELLPFYLREDFRKSFLLRFEGRTLECINIHTLPEVLDKSSVTYSLVFYDNQLKDPMKKFKSGIEIEFNNTRVLSSPLNFTFEADQLNKA